MASKKGFKPPARKSENASKSRGIALTDSQYEEIFNAVLNNPHHNLKSPITGDSAGILADEPKECASIENSQHSQSEKRTTKPKNTDTSSISTLHSEDFIQKAVSSTPVKKIVKSFRESLKNLKKKVDSGSLDTSLCSSIQEVLEDVPLSQPPKYLTHLQKMLWLQDRRGTGLWVQCDHEQCGKWRWVDTPDPLDLPDKWFCHMNIDKTMNKCSFPEKPLSTHLEEDLIHNKYTAGSIVWAKMFGYPWWPAIVCDDPDTEQYYWLELFDKVPTFYHVTFFDSAAVTRSWITPKNLISFKHHPDQDTKFPVNLTFKNRIAYGKKQAKDALTLHIKDRLRKYSYVARCPNSIHTPIPSADESDSEFESKKKSQHKTTKKERKESKSGSQKNSKNATNSKQVGVKKKVDTSQKINSYKNSNSRKIEKLGTNSHRTSTENIVINRKTSKNSKKNSQNQDEDISGKTKKLTANSRRNSTRKSVEKSQKNTDDESDIEISNLNTSSRTNNSRKSVKNSKKNSQNQNEDKSKIKKVGTITRRNSTRKSMEKSQKNTDDESDTEILNLNTSSRTNNSRKSVKSYKKNLQNQEEQSSEKMEKLGANSRRYGTRKSVEKSQSTDVESDEETLNLNTSLQYKNNSRKSVKNSKENSQNQDVDNSREIKKSGTNTRRNSTRKSLEKSQKKIDDESDTETPNLDISSRTNNSRKSVKNSVKNTPTQNEKTSKKMKRLDADTQRNSSRKSAEYFQEMTDNESNECDNESSQKIVSRKPVRNSKNNSQNEDEESFRKTKNIDVNSQQNNKHKSEEYTDNDQKKKIMDDFLKDVDNQAKVEVKNQKKMVKRFCSPFISKINKNDSTELVKSKDIKKRKTNDTVFKSTPLPKRIKNTFIPPIRTTLNTSNSSLGVTSSSSFPDQIFDDDFDSEINFSTKK